MASFQVGATFVNFGALIEHEDVGGAVRELTIGTRFLTEVDWNTFRSLVCWDAEMVPMPWGNTVEVLIKGGPIPASGTLIILGLNPPQYTAYLVDARRNVVTPSGNCKGTAKFWLVTP